MFAAHPSRELQFKKSRYNFSNWAMSIKESKLISQRQRVKENKKETKIRTKFCIQVSHSTCHLSTATCQMSPDHHFIQLHMLRKFQEVWWRSGYIQSWNLVVHKFVFTKWQFLCLQLKEEINPVGRWKGPKFLIGHKGTKVQKFLIETLVFS